jgi:hypothetical protein
MLLHVTKKVNVILQDAYVVNDCILTKRYAPEWSHIVKYLLFITARDLNDCYDLGDSVCKQENS